MLPFHYLSPNQEENILRFESLNSSCFRQVDMTAFVHMSDEDLKAIGIPMVKSMELPACRCFFFLLIFYLFITFCLFFD